MAPTGYTGPDGEVVALYLLIAGVLRFAIEFIRMNERVTLGLPVAHWASLVMVVLGLMSWHTGLRLVTRCVSLRLSPTAMAAGESAIQNPRYLAALQK